MSVELYQQALARYRGNDLAGAEELCRAVLRGAPEHADTLHLLGLVYLRSGQPQPAAELILASLGRNPHQPLARCNLGIALLQLERLPEALASFEDALRLAPDTVLAVYNRANVLQASGRHEEAILGYDRALALHADFFEALNNRGNSLLALERPAEALQSFQRALALRPEDAQAVSNREIALRAIREASLQASREGALHGDFDASVSATADELHRRGLEAVKSGDLLAAVEWLRAAVAANPNQAVAHGNLGTALLDLKRPAEALECFGRALQLSPGYTLALYNHGTALLELRRFEEALVSLEEVLRVDPNHAHALVNHGAALRELQRNDVALLSLERALSLVPDFKYLLGTVAYLRLQQCDWKDYESLRARVREGVLKGQPVDVPFSFLSLSDSTDEQLRCAQVFVQEQMQGLPIAPATRSGEPCAGGRVEPRRIRVAYVSRDFREHAVSYLMVGVLEQHDRSRFEVVGVSLRADDGSAMGERVRRACDRFISVGDGSDVPNGVRGLHGSDEEISLQIREVQADIVVDLVGFTEGVRPGILASRPAPIQVNYLGFPGTLAAPYIDYILADEFVIPTDTRSRYSEQVVYLPECFQANDDERPIEHSLTRAECGLPDSALVLCCFNNTFKLSPPFFDIWLRLLERRPETVLWLLADRPIVQRNLRAYAGARGVDAERLVFAPRLPYARHLGRMALADLFLDTLPFNAGTTASDALWAGVPVLTCVGEAFAARMAGSLLKTLGLPELITHNVVEYEARALELTADVGRLGALRERLAHARTHAPLFDTARFTRHLERAYAHMYELHQSGLAPRSFQMPPLD